MAVGCSVSNNDDGELRSNDDISEFQLTYEYSLK